MPAKARSMRYADKAALQSLGLFYDPDALRKFRARNHTGFDTALCERRMIDDLLPHQKGFVCDFDHRYVLYVGGLGCMGAESLVDVFKNGEYVKTPIKDLCDSPFFVKTLAGPALALPAYRKGFATLYRVELEDGRQFLATKDHRCLSPQGWVPVEHLAEGSAIAADGISDVAPDREKSIDLSASDQPGSRSCDEQQNPLAVFVQEQIEQLDVSNTLNYPCPSALAPAPCIGDSVRRLANQMASVNYEIARKIELSSLLRHTYEQVHGNQSDCSDTPRSGQAAGDPRTRLQARQLFHGEGFGSPWPESSQPALRSALTTFPGHAWRTCALGPELEVGRAYNSRVGLPGCSWSRVKTVVPVGEDYYYDFHVPVLNHYIADGVVHHNSGKSYSSVVKALLLAFRSQGEQHIYLEPTYPMINQVALPTWFKVMDKYNVPYTFRRAPSPEITLKLPRGDTKILLLPLLNYERLVGINAASLVIDEADTVKQEIAEAALVRLQGRVRVGNCPQICFASTPEGRRFVWNFFEKNKTDDKELYRADTRDNPYLDDNYVVDLLEKYPPHLVDAYVKGLFTNLETATVFSEYGRDANESKIFHAEDGEPILVGADFNVGKCSSVYAVMRNSERGQALHIFDEVIVRDTFSLAEHIKRKFAKHVARGMVIVYPDSSGSHASTSSTQSDHDILREAGLKVIADKRNPPIAETVSMVNNYLHKKQILVNTATCNNTVEMFENWAYDSTLKPSKNGTLDYSHFGDALRYLVWQSMPRPAVGLGRGQRWR